LELALGWSTLLLTLLFPVASIAADSTELGFLFSFGNFSGARAISVSPNGQVYVADTENNKVKVFSARGDSVREVGGYGWGQLEFDRPYGVFAGDGLNIYVPDYGNHRIQRFDRNLNYISTLYTRDDDDASKRFGYPAGVALSRLGDLFLLDTENIRVLKVNASSAIERNFGGIDAGKGRLQSPHRIGIAANDLVCVLDQDRIVVYDYFGNFIRTIGLGVLEEPRGLAIERDTLYVAAQQKVFLFDLQGKLLEVLELDRPSEAPSTASRVNDIAIQAGKLYALTDKEVRVFDLRRKNSLDNH
jgi:DNA-binding beta-propeller fold protein YncE